VTERTCRAQRRRGLHRGGPAKGCWGMSKAAGLQRGAGQCVECRERPGWGGARLSPPPLQLLGPAPPGGPEAPPPLRRPQPPAPPAPAPAPRRRRGAPVGAAGGRGTSPGPPQPPPPLPPSTSRPRRPARQLPPPPPRCCCRPWPPAPPLLLRWRQSCLRRRQLLQMGPRPTTPSPLQHRWPGGRGGCQRRLQPSMERQRRCRRSARVAPRRCHAHLLRWPTAPPPAPHPAWAWPAAGRAPRPCRPGQQPPGRASRCRSGRRAAWHGPAGGGGGGGE
jgi:hypothetical protein